MDKVSMITMSTILNGSPIATFVIDCNHKIVHWNQACAKLTGIPTAEMIDTHYQWRAFYPAHRPIMADLVADGANTDLLNKFYRGKYRRSAVVEGAIEAEDYFPAIGENGRWLLFSAAPLRDENGKLVGAIETLIDITERKLAEQAVRTSERRFRDIVEGSPVPKFVIDAEHRITHWNKACELLTGVKATEMLGSRETWRAFYAFDQRKVVMADLIVDRADLELVAKHYGGCFRRSATIEHAWEAEDFFPNFGDNGLWVYFTAAPLYDLKGNIVGAIETLQDVTARKQAEEALQLAKGQAE